MPRAIAGSDGRSPPRPAAAPAKLNPRPFAHEFRFSDRKEATIKQDKHDNNEMSVMFRVQSNDGKSVDALKKEDFQVSENKVPVTNFKVKADEKKSYQVVDIVFVVDITGSMDKFINDAKFRLRDFIRRTYPKYHIRMCLSTFGDYVVKKCDRFYDNSRPAQVKEFLDALFNLSIKKGQGEYPGELDWEENSMRALTEATKAPWAQDSQRFVILVSDADFYSPEKPSKFFAQHQARPDASAPSMPEVHQAIKDSGVKVFSVTPPAAGYNSPLGEHADITTASMGEWFEFKKVIAKQITLDAIFGKILERINTTYLLTYIVEQNQGLKAGLTKDQRQIQVSSSKGTVKIEQINSTMPNGRAEYKNRWTLSEKVINRASVKGWMDGKPLANNQFEIEKGDVIMKEVPKAGASLRFTYFYENLFDNMNMEPMIFDAAMTHKNTKVYLNDKLARQEDIIFSNDIDGDTSLSFGPAVMSSTDPYEIRRNEGLRVRLDHQP